jgi:hypothetical protein
MAYLPCPDHVGRVRRVKLADVVLPFQDLECQPFGCMSRNMTVHKPAARVVGFEGDDDEAASGQKHNIASRGVVELEIESVDVIVLIFGLLEDGEIMAV